MIDLHPLHDLSIATQALLYQFLNKTNEQGMQEYFWPKGTQISPVYQLAVNIVKRSREKETNKEFRFECFDEQSNKINPGKKNVIVCNSQGTFHLDIPNKITVIAAKPLKSRIIKLRLFDAKNNADGISSAEKEYNNSPRQSLHFKPVTHFMFKGQPASILVGRKFLEGDLYDIICKDLMARGLQHPFKSSPETILSFKDRLLLTLEILKAYKEQVANENITHGDIKSENIRVTRHPNSFEVRFIDFETASKLSEPLSTQVTGTFSCIPPELLALIKSNNSFNFSKNWLYQNPTERTKWDIYSLGRTLYLLWGEYDDSYSSNNPKVIADMTGSTNGLFAGFNEDDPHFTPDNQALVRNLLNIMLEKDPIKRPNIDEVIALLSETNLEESQDPKRQCTISRL